MGFGLGSRIRALASRVLGLLASKAILRRLLAFLPTLAILAIHPVYATGVGDLAGNLAQQLPDFGTLLGAIAGIMLGVGIVGKFLPWGSFQTKQAFGRLFDYALLMGALLAIGTFMIYFAGDIAVTVAGKGEAPEPGGPWQVPGA